MTLFFLSIFDTLLINTSLVNLNYGFNYNMLYTDFSSLGSDFFFIENKTNLGIGVSFDLNYQKLFNKLYARTYTPYLHYRLYYKELKNNYINSFLMTMLYFGSSQNLYERFDINKVKYGVKIFFGNIYSVELYKREFKDLKNFNIGFNIALGKSFTLKKEKKLLKNEDLPKNIFEADKKLQEIEKHLQFLKIDLNNKKEDINIFEKKVYLYHSKIRDRIIKRENVAILLALGPFSSLGAIIGAYAGYYNSKEFVDENVNNPYDVTAQCCNEMCNTFLVGFLIFGYAFLGSTFGFATGFLTTYEYYNIHLTPIEEKELRFIIEEFNIYYNEAINN